MASREHQDAVQMYRQAIQTAKDNNMFVVERSGTYIIYRRNPKNPQRNFRLGACTGIKELYQKVSRCAASQPSH